MGSRSIFNMERGPSVVRMMSATACTSRQIYFPSSRHTLLRSWGRSQRRARQRHRSLSSQVAPPRVDQRQQPTTYRQLLTLAALMFAAVAFLPVSRLLLSSGERKMVSRGSGKRQQTPTATRAGGNDLPMHLAAMHAHAQAHHVSCSVPSKHTRAEPSERGHAAYNTPHTFVRLLRHVPASYGAFGHAPRRPATRQPTMRDDQHALREALARAPGPAPRSSLALGACASPRAMPEGLRLRNLLMTMTGAPAIVEENRSL